MFTSHRQSPFSFFHLDLDERLDSLCPRSSPSEIIINVPKIHELLEGVTARIHLGRPGGAPVAIFNPALATLQQHLDNLDQIQVTPRDVQCATDYIKRAIEFYPDEAARENAIKGIFDAGVGQGGDWDTRLNWADGIKPDCCWWYKEFLTMVLELKNMLGLDGNPMLQAIIDYSKIVSHKKVRLSPSVHFDSMAYLLLN